MQETITCTPVEELPELVTQTDLNRRRYLQELLNRNGRQAFYTPYSVQNGAVTFCAVGLAAYLHQSSLTPGGGDDDYFTRAAGYLGAETHEIDALMCLNDQYKLSLEQISNWAKVELGW